MYSTIVSAVFEGFVATMDDDTPSPPKRDPSVLRRDFLPSQTYAMLSLYRPLLTPREEKALPAEKNISSVSASPNSRYYNTPENTIINAKPLLLYTNSKLHAKKFVLSMVVLIPHCSPYVSSEE